MSARLPRISSAKPRPKTAVTSLGWSRKSTQESDSEFDIWKLIKRTDTSTPYTLTLRYRSDGRKPKTNGRCQRNSTIARRRRRRGRHESGTESDSGDSVRTSNTDVIDNDSYFKDDYDFDAEEPPEPPLYPHLVHKPGTYLQELYRKACKEYGVVRYTKFYKGLASDKIVMRRQRLSPLDIKTCAIALMEAYSIHTLDLGENDIGPSGASYIAELLVENQFIKHLLLQDNHLKTQGVTSLVNVIKQFDSLTTVDMSGNGLQEADAEALKPLITDTVHLKVLNLSHNEFREKGGKIIGEALALNDTLQQLDLSWNHLRRQGAIKIAEALTNNSGLLVLDLSWNGFHSPGGNALAKALGKNATLTELNIASNRIDDELLGKLLTGLKKNTTLKTLKMGQNPFSPEAATEFLLFLKNNESVGVTNLDLTDQLVKSSFLEILHEIQQARPLEVIWGRVKDNDENPIGNDEKTLLDEDPVLILMEFGKLMGFRLIDLFAALDKDGNRSLDHFEIQNGLKMLNLPLNDMCIDLLIKKLDKDMDGQIDFGELMSARTCHRQKAEQQFGIRNQQVDVGETDVGRVRLKLHRLMAKRMSGNPEFKRNVESMRRTLSGLGGETKLRQEMLKKTLEFRMSKMVVEDNEMIM